MDNIVSDLMYDNHDMEMIEAIQEASVITDGIECLLTDFDEVD